MILSLFVAGTPMASENLRADSTSSGWLLSLLVIVGLIGATALIVMGLALWSRKQDQHNRMLSISIRHIIDSRDTGESRKAAEALGTARDPAAMLVLIEVATDDDTEESVRGAAHKALENMRINYHKYNDFIDQALSAIDQSDHRKLVDLLINTFERSDARYVQSAYLIGREFLRSGNGEDAREWLKTAAFRDKELPLYGNQIRRLGEKCTAYLFDEGDSLYKVGRYQDARERYAAASHGLDEESVTHYRAYLRMACVYCKLHRYFDAEQATARALQQERTDSGSALAELLRNLNARSSTAQASDDANESEDIKGRIDACVDGIMDEVPKK